MKLAIRLTTGVIICCLLSSHVFADPVRACDVTKDTAIWGGALGSTANQKPMSKNFGYTATASGSIIGVEHFTASQDIYGLAFAVTNSNLHEFGDAKFKNRMLGFHFIAYGSKNLCTESYFLEWLLTGVTNKNESNRFASYRNAQGGARINLGQVTDNDTWTFSLIETLSYAGFYQPHYANIATSTTTTSHINPKHYTNILTAGGGVRWAITEDNPWMRGNGELRFMGTYDAITTNQTIAANFLNSVSDFSIFSAPGRWAFMVGATYTCTFFECLQLQFSYDFQLRTKYTDNSAEIKFRYLF